MEKTKTSSPWGLVFLFIGIFSLFLIGLTQTTHIKKPDSNTELVATDVTGFTFSGGEIIAYEGNAEVLEIPKCYSYGPTTTITGTITFENRGNAFDFLQEYYAIGAEGYYDFFDEIYTHEYPWVYDYSINQYSYVAGTDIIVNSISDSAFKYNKDIVKVVIPNTIETIGNYAFEYCSNLQEVELNEGLKTIGDSAFEYCAIEKIVIPNSVEKMYAYTFFGCSKLQSAIIGENMSSIYGGTFNACTNLKTVTILSENEIYAWATDVYQTFSRCPSLETIYIKERMMNYYKTTEPWNRYTEFYKVIE